jgi:indolepyruvate ferredoxin oxidoreductase
VRREERALVAWYNGLLDSALAALTPDNYDSLLEIVRLPDGIRGYEEIKLAAIARTRRLAEEKLGTATRAA